MTYIKVMDARFFCLFRIVFKKDSKKQTPI